MKLVKGLVVVACLLMLLVPSVLAQEPCEADFNCDQNVDAADVDVFIADFGRSPFNDPCPDCYDSPCPCTPLPLPKTGQTSPYTTNDDGDLQMGVELPNPRFTDNGDETITDNLTGLMWQKDANCMATNYSTLGDGRVPWQHALDFVAGINDGTYPDCGAGYDDWRLPNSNELVSLVNERYYEPAVSNTAGTGQGSEGDPFTNHSVGWVWSSTTAAYDTNSAWLVILFSGQTHDDYKSALYSVWAVRGGQ